MTQSCHLFVTTLFLILSIRLDDSNMLVSPKVNETKKGKIDTEPVKERIDQFTYLPQLSEFFPAIKTPEDLHTPKLFKSLFQPEDIRHFSPDKKNLASKAITDLLYFHTGDIAKFKEFIYDKECNVANPVFIRKTGELTDLNVSTVIKFIKLFENFRSIYTSWIKEINQIKPLDTGKLVVDKNYSNKLKQTIKSYKTRFKEFNTKYEPIAKNILLGIDKLECGIKDITIFFNNIRRFHRVYKKGKKGSIVQKAYTKLWIHRTIWTNYMNKLIRRVRFIQLWTSLFNEYIDYCEGEANPEYVTKMNYVLINFQIFISYTSEILKSIAVNFEKIHKDVNKIITVLEEHHKLEIKNFPDLKTIYDLSN